MLLKLKKFTNILFMPKYLLYTNAVIGSGSLVIGYVAADKFRSLITKEYVSKEMNFSRTSMLTILGAFYGMYETFGYNFIDKIKIKKAIFLKLFLDQLLLAPPAVGLFLFVNEAYDKNFNWNIASEYTKSSFLPVYAFDMVFWLPAQYINFRFLPHRFRYAYVAGASIMGNIVLTSLHFNFQKNNDVLNKSK